MVGQVAGIEQEPSGAQGTDEPGVKPVDFEALVDSEKPLALIGIFNSARMASASATVVSLAAGASTRSGRSPTSAWG